MNSKQGTGIRLRGCCLAIGVALAAASPAQAATWDWGDWSGSWDNTISYGISWRAEDPDPALIGRGNGGTAEAILTDDGNLNFEQGDIFSNIIKGTSEIELTNGQFGVFGRIKYWYDYELENGNQLHGNVVNDYQANAKLDDSGFADYAKFKGLALLDLFVYGSFELGDYPLDLRVGRQVLNWGEAFLIQGINVLNPIDVSAVRRPGVEIKEALLPVALIYGNLGLPAGFSLEAYYQFKWEETVIDGCGTYFSNADFAAKGCNDLIAPEVEIAPGIWLPDSVLQNINSVRKDPFIDEASDSGQFGLALRNYVDSIGTEFGVYYQRLHNRTPVLNVNYATQAALDGSVLGGGPVPVYYQVAYPEDIDIYGFSFATNIGVVAVQGEISLTKDLPVGVNGTTELQGGLGVLATQGQFCSINPALYGQFGPRACAAFGEWFAEGGPTNLEASGISRGWDRFDVTQLQTSFLYFWEQGLGAERVQFVGEVAYVDVEDLPDISVMPYGRNPAFGAPTTGLGGPSDDGFVTGDSWGYRFRASASYPNVFAGVELSPSLAWAHDVDGTSPTPAFVDGRKAFSLALGANYLTKYRASVSYTWFTGGYANTARDRDFISFTVSMDF
jgi:hypothetical protein